MPSKRDVLGLLCRADLVKFIEHCDPDTLMSVRLASDVRIVPAKRAP